MRNRLSLQGGFDSWLLSRNPRPGGASGRRQAWGGQDAGGLHKPLYHGGSCRREITVWEEHHGEPGRRRGVRAAGMHLFPPLGRISQKPSASRSCRRVFARRRPEPREAALGARRPQRRGAGGAAPSSAFSASPLLLAALSARDQPCCSSASEPKYHPPFAPRPRLPAYCSA